MSNKDQKKKATPVDWNAISERNLSGKGWTSESFGISSAVATSGGPTTNVVKAPINAMGTPATTLASNYVSPQDQAKITAALQNPAQAKAAQGPVQAATGFLASLFDFTDTQDNPVEWAWDGLWRSLGWGYDRINQGASWAVSAAPGGVQTFNWDQAGQISYGQASLAAGAKNQTEYGSIGGSILSALTNPFAMVGGALASADLAGPLGDKNFDVTNAGMRKAAFEDSTVGKWASGLSDAVFTTVADPLLFAGKAAKVSKLKYLDDIFQGESGLARLETQMVESLPKAMQEKAPIAQFAARTAEVDPVTGKKVLSTGVIAQRLRGATGGEMIASALYHNTDEATAQLIIRHAMGDPNAAAELIAKRPSLGIPIARKQREYVMDLLNRDPAQKQKLMDASTKAQIKLDKQLKKTAPDTPEYNNLLKSKQRAEDTYAALDNGTLGTLDDMSDPVLQGVLSAEFKDQVKNDAALSKFLQDEELRIKTTNAFAGSKRGFSADNAFGRRVEESRMKRNQTAYEIAMGRGQYRGTGKMITLADGNQVEELKKVSLLTKNGWTKDQFGRNGFNRAINVWRWMGEENPSGFIQTKGAAAMGSWKEINAVLNDIDIYSGPQRNVVINTVDKNGKTVAETVAVGGAKRREELLNMYMDAVNTSTSGTDAAQQALQTIEKFMFNDMAAWHGMSKEAAEKLQTQAFSKRDGLIQNIKDQGFWIDENGTKNAAPWLESQMQNGTYMINYKTLNKAMRLHDETGAVLKWDKAGQFVGQNAKDFYDAFNEVWRPSVLLRLGYTQRNVAEGLFRASAYTFSLDPLRYAAIQAGKTPRNFARHVSYAKTLKSADAVMRLRKAGENNAMLPKKFVSWLDNEIAARDEDIAKLNQFIAQPGRFIEDVNLESRNFMLDFYRGQENHLVSRIDKAKAAGADAEELKSLADELAVAVESKTRVSKIKEFQLGDYEKQAAKIRRSRRLTAEEKQTQLAALDASNSELLTATSQVLDDMKLIGLTLADSMERRMALDVDETALSAFRQQGQAKSRIMNGVINAPDGTVLKAAFNRDNPYTSVALSNLSADATTRSMSVSAANTMNNAFRAHRLKTYVNVKPGDANYFEGVASALKQVKFSEIGKMAIDGASPDEIAQFLFKHPEGRQIFEFIVDGENKVLREKGVKTGALNHLDYDQALEVANQTIDRYYTLAPDPELRQFMKTMTPDSTFNGDYVETFLAKKDSAGQALYDLKPVVGHISEELGTAKVRETINHFTSAGMKWLGTFPEDALVRAPFYGKRYQDSLMEMIDTLQASIGKDAKISMRQYSDLMQQAHLRALKDTKDWMFTIERRTNLGTYGEIAIPFISATQNSVTTVGRLLWNDPSVGVLMTDLWRAPSKMQLTDDQGNIHIPIPHDWIPDGVEAALGIQNQLDMTFRPSQLNLIAPQMDQGTLFQFGPTVAIPMGAFMQHNFLIGPDAPGLLVTALGQDKANSLWSFLKDYTFGPDGVPSANLSDQLLPAWAKRAVQLFQKEGSPQYAKIYNANYHTEYAKWRGGMRATEPTKDEITNMTNNLTIIQLLGNVVGAFPPGYESTLQPFVDEYRSLQNNPLTKNDAERLFTEKYGADFLANSSLGLTKSVAPTVQGMVADAFKYENLISKVSPELKNLGDLSVLSMVFSDNPQGIFDGSIYAWQMENAIPGVSDMYRERMTPEEAFLNDSKNAGWAKFTQTMNQLDARLASMGLKSYSQSPQLMAEKQNFILSMGQDPMYRGWFNSYNEHSGSTSKSAVMLMQTALSDAEFVKAHQDSPVWQAASEYLKGRAQVLNQLSAQGGSITSVKNQNVASWWDTYRSNLKNVPGWDAFANRFLSGDDDPSNPGVSFASVMSGE